MFTENELKEIDAFEKQHMDCYKGTGKPLSFTITENWGTGIGVNTYIKCTCCGEEKDITDYDAW